MIQYILFIFIYLQFSLFFFPLFIKIKHTLLAFICSNLCMLHIWIAFYFVSNLDFDLKIFV